MKTYFKLAFIAFSLIVSTGAAKAQAFNHLSVGLEAGTYGPGLTVATNLSSHLLLRGGVDFAKSAYKPTDMTFDVTGHTTEGEDIDMVLKANELTVNFVNAKLGLEFYPMENGIFSIGAGAYLGKSNFALDTKVNNYDSNKKPYFQFEDVTVQPNSDGTMTGDVKLGNSVKPYFVLSLGRSIAANHRLSFKFDLGLIYQGDIKFSSPNSVNIHLPEDADKQLDSPLLKCWPLLNFTLAYKIF
jgi:hypothetical protein